MRHLIIDTDTASDDAIALLMALREPDVNVEAITVVAGNCPLETCVKNALTSIELAQTYQPPVYPGISKPLIRKQSTGVGVHGEDGLGNSNLPKPHLNAEDEHAVNKIIELANKFAGELEIITIGPLSNLATALLMAPDIANKIKHVYIMGGAGIGPGNVTPVAEFNFWADAEAAQIVIQSSLTKTIVGWDICASKAFFYEQDIQQLANLGPLGEFAANSTKLLREFGQRFGKDGIDLADPTAVAVALYPELVTKELQTHAYVDYQGSTSYGQFVIDQFKTTGLESNCNIVLDIDAPQFKKQLYSLLRSET